MLNPSTADATHDDPTIRRCIAFAARENLGGVEVMNLFAFRATAPADLMAAADPVGPDNDRHLDELFVRHATVLAAWGAHGAFAGRAAAVVRLAADRGTTLACLGMTLKGEPLHPLYVKGDRALGPYFLGQPA